MRTFRLIIRWPRQRDHYYDYCDREKVLAKVDSALKIGDFEEIRIEPE